MGDTLAVLSLAVAFVFYRLDVLRGRRRDIESTSWMLEAVRDAMVNGWAKVYFANNWSRKASIEAANYHAKKIREEEYEQILVVPTEPLVALVGNTSASTLISQETMAAANLGLWHVQVFNQFVQQQTDMVASALFELNDPDLTDERREGLAQAIGSQAYLLHRRGVGEQNKPGGWYHSLCESLRCDIERLREAQRARSLYALADLFAVILLLAAIGAFAYAALA